MPTRVQPGPTDTVERASTPGSRPATGRRRAGRLASGGAIREAAARLFLERGYDGTSMDDIAAEARVSKQTIYTHFADKEALFASLVLANADRVETFLSTMREMLSETSDVRRALQQLARTYLRFVIRPEVIRLRRLVLAEAARFPEVAQAYYERVPQRVYTVLAELLDELDSAGALRIDDKERAAQQFAWLVLGETLDRGMFLASPDAVASDDDADAAVNTFLAAYGVH